MWGPDVHKISGGTAVLSVSVAFNETVVNRLGYHAPWYRGIQNGICPIELGRHLQFRSAKEDIRPRWDHMLQAL